MKDVPTATKERLLVEARYRCCIHRLTWIRIAQANEGARKEEPLHIHHVRFRSRGGSNSPRNLVPLCPTCHSMIHDSHRAGAPILTDKQLRDHWTLWKRLRDVVQSETAIGSGPSTIEVVVDLGVYGLRPRFSIGGEVLYTDARKIIFDSTVVALHASDPHFPFRGSVDLRFWTLSSDRLVAADVKWNEVRAAEVFAREDEPLVLSAPQRVELEMSSNPMLSNRPEHRRL